MRSDELDIPQTGPRAVPPLSWRERQRHDDSGGNRRLALIAAAIGGAVVAVVAVLMLGGGHSGSGVPLVEAPAGPVRSAPKNPGGIQPVGMDEDLSSGPLSADRLAPPPETPNLAALRAQRIVNSPAAPASNPASTVPAAMPAVAAAPSRPETQPRPAPQPVAAARHVTPLPVHPARQPMPAERRQAAPVAAGHVQVQLAALGTKAAAETEWRLLSRRLPGLLGRRQPHYERVVAHGQVFWRLRLAGFSDAQAAANFCADLHRHRTACDVARF